jgi:hypothetical protein
MSRPPPARVPFRTDQPGEDDFLAHVKRVLAARPQPAATKAEGHQPAGRSSPASTPTVHPAGTESELPHTLLCGGCGSRIECLAEDRERFERDGCPACGGGLAGRISACPGDPRRRVRRRARGETWVEVRRTERRRLADLAVALVDVCADGLGLWLAEPVRPGEVVTVTLKAGRRRLAASAVVRWCALGPDSAYRAGLGLHRRLTDRDMADFAV